MKRKGFTLIELLAVILILGVIALIAIPVVNNIIGLAKEGSLKASANNYFRAVNQMLSIRTLNEVELTDGVYTPDEIETYDIDVKGNKPENGFITIVNNELVQATLYIDDFIVEYVDDETSIINMDNSGVYKEPVLNGTDPVLKDGLVPVVIQANGKVVKADVSDSWYSYMTKNWANAVLLVDNSLEYDAGDEISSENIEAYFVWIPKYKYEIFDIGDYKAAVSGAPEVTQKKEIKIVFGTENTIDSKKMSAQHHY